MMIGATLFVIILGLVALGLGVTRDLWFAQRIGRQAPASADVTDPTVESLERLHQLYESGALTQDEYESQKKRILGA
jgi:hypothetical protein